MPAKSETLVGVPMFRSLERAVIKALDARCDWRRVAAKEWVIDYQDDGIDVFFVVAGAVRVLIYAKSGREVILADLEAGGFFGELAPIDGRPRRPPKRLPSLDPPPPWNAWNHGGCGVSNFASNLAEGLRQKRSSDSKHAEDKKNAFRYTRHG